MPCTNLNLFGHVAGLFTVSSLIPQVWQTAKTRKAEDLNILHMLLSIAAASAWAVFAFANKIWVLFGSNVLWVVLMIVLIVLKLHGEFQKRGGEAK